MDKQLGKRIVILCFVLILLILLFLIYEKIILKHYSYSYKKTTETLYNPMMGFAPSADYTDAVGKNQLVYVEVTFKELEPEEGKFDFDAINETYQLDKWKAEGKKVVFRFICDKPSDEAHMDIPEWLYEKTKDGVSYDTDYGKGYSPKYENTTFIEEHKKAIEALGKEYGKDDFFCYIELGSLGHWGEWHVKYDQGIPKFPDELTCKKYIEVYKTAFPNAMFLMRRPFEFVKQNKWGVYNDMTGAKEDTDEWLSWIKDGGSYQEAVKPIKLLAVKKIWNQAPVGGEFTSGDTIETMITDKLQQTLQLLEESHMTFIGPNCPIANLEIEKNPKQIKQVMDKIGYRYGVSETKITYNKYLKSADVQIDFNNYGVAPMYANWPVYLYLLDKDGNVIKKVETKIELSKLFGNEKGKYHIRISDALLAKSMPKVGIAVCNPKTAKPEVQLDMKTTQKDLIYLLNE